MDFITAKYSARKKILPVILPVSVLINMPLWQFIDIGTEIETLKVKFRNV
jgi:hypothetical protein